MVWIIEESVVADASDVQIHPNVNLRVRGLGKSPSADLDVIGTAMITIELGEVSVKHPALVVRGLGHSCLLENDFLIEHGVKVDFSNQTVHIRNRTFQFHSEERRLWRKRQTMKFERVATSTVSDGVFFSEDMQNKVNLRRKIDTELVSNISSRKDTNDCPSVGHQLSTTSSEMKMLVVDSCLSIIHCLESVPNRECNWVVYPIN
ncbi:Retroviral-like aspartic protease [Trichinella spiralis]|uniref:Retroviral-like aspartic protease n=1 Tax=Trichinella spiralis TaxID=6334 RepID=A0ABR3KGN5_TRISP